MSLINSIIEFTNIGLKQGLTIDIIKYIVAKNNDLIQCDLCLYYFSCMWYFRSCIRCKKNTIKCCHICWKNDILIYKGCYCVKCKCWWCGNCCNEISVFEITGGNAGWRYINCTCSWKQFVSNTFSQSQYNAVEDKFTKRSI